MDFDLTELEKKMSPSEAGRYAAEMRWRTHSGAPRMAGDNTISLPDRLNRATDNMLAKGGSVSHLGVDESDAVLRGAMMMVERTFSEARMNQRDYELNVHAQKSWNEARKDPSAMLHVVRVGRNIAAVAVTVRPNDATVEIRHLSSTGVLKGAGSALLGSIIKKGVKGGRTTFRVTPSEESKSFWDEYGFSGAVYDQLGNPDGSQDLVVKPEWLRVLKAMSRSEAGKVAAQARWKNHVKTTDATPVAPPVQPSTPKKIATKQGIGRALNDAGIKKTGYIYSSRIRGYATPTSGWESVETENGFKVTFKMVSGGVRAHYSQSQEVKDRISAVNQEYIDGQLKRMHDALKAKGYDTSFDGETIFVNNTSPVLGVSSRSSSPAKMRQIESVTTRFTEMSNSVAKAFSEEYMKKAGLKLTEQGYGQKEATEAELKLGKEKKDFLIKILDEQGKKAQGAIENLAQGFMPLSQKDILQGVRSFLKSKEKETVREMQSKGLGSSKKEDTTVGSMVYSTTRAVLENARLFIDLAIERATPLVEKQPKG